MSKNMYRLTLILVSLFLAMNLGCQGSSSGEKKEAPTGGAPEGQTTKVFPNGIMIDIAKLVELREDQSNFPEFKENLNVFQARISIPETLYKASTEIRRSHKADAVNPGYEVVPKASAEYKDGYYVVTDTFRLFERSLVKSSVAYKVYVDEKAAAGNTVILLPDLVVPKVTDKALTLDALGMASGKYEFGNLILERDAVLFTQGAEIQLFTNRLISDQARIETFSHEEAIKAADDLDNGRSGGAIYLQAKTGTGSLHVEMRGTKGGKGAIGDNASGTGTTGGTGADGVAYTECEPHPRFAVSVPRESDVLMMVNRPIETQRCYSWCERNPGSGGQGGKGPTGGKGKKGGTGGSSGTINILVNKAQPNVQITVNRIPGEGGEGGEGGKGGSGGAGGAAGSQPRSCKAASAGATGPTGDQGPKGDSGDVIELDNTSSVIVDGKEIL
ncbi:hypothetical protein [Bdellovibrio reynosensis]|uniref:Collagen-like protein n=1 Tax=Bdellovibrio reynosensis TaxID=2835041 RepID=A0ABY4C8T7_9BACT|nr:hypothetical protein [Bdellovibrio reynosensis]UOF00091.1 hypothetical protein MNR06_10295 [Bdellovibrio reynosensis]